MKNLDLNAYNVTEMNQQEMMEMNGGINWKGLIGFVVGSAVAIAIPGVGGAIGLGIFAALGIMDVENEEKKEEAATE
jgi:hypothetical protein